MIDSRPCYLLLQTTNYDNELNEKCMPTQGGPSFNYVQLKFEISCFPHLL